MSKIMRSFNGGPLYESGPKTWIEAIEIHRRLILFVFSFFLKNVLSFAYIRQQIIIIERFRVQISMFYKKAYMIGIQEMDLSENNFFTIIK